MAALSDQDQTRLALASLFAALVQTMYEQDKPAQLLFAKKLERLYRNMEDHQDQPLGAMEALRWTRDLLDPR